MSNEARGIINSLKLNVWPFETNKEGFFISSCNFQPVIQQVSFIYHILCCIVTHGCTSIEKNWHWVNLLDVYSQTSVNSDNIPRSNLLDYQIHLIVLNIPWSKKWRQQISENCFKRCFTTVLLSANEMTWLFYQCIFIWINKSFWPISCCWCLFIPPENKKNRCF